MIETVCIYAVIVSLSNANTNEIYLSKHDYTVPVTTVNKNTIDYNYITTEELIKSNIQKYQEILP